MVSVRLDRITKTYEQGRVVAVNNVSLEVREGELFTLLGPSGCGKTTTLRLIAGFEFPDSGKIFFDEEDVTMKKPYERGTAMVFQNYALWPHMTVFDNVAYGLRIMKLPKDEIRRRVKNALELVQLEGLENRFPNQLSGGQQQRVALARALVVEPRVLLLDEPLSNLDARLRLEMREEIKRLQKKLGITTIYVTHDQEEAMSISDRIAVMNQGLVLQVGTPEEIYFEPSVFFVATFIGKPTILDAEVEEEGKARTSNGLLLKYRLAKGQKHPSNNDKIKIVLKPEHFTINPSDPKEYNRIEGRVELKMFVGHHLQVKVKTDGDSIMAYIPPEHEVKIGEKIKLFIPVERTLAFTSW